MTAAVEELQVIAEAAAAVSVLDPVRRRVLAALGQPQSAVRLAKTLGLTRQKVNYHVRALERHDLVREVEQRHWGGITERVMSASASSYVVSPEALGELGGDPRSVTDRLSARYLIALAARLIREVGSAATAADRAGKQLATFSVDTEIRFDSAADRAACAEELAETVRHLAVRYHRGRGRGRSHRLIIAMHAIPDADGPDQAGRDRHG